MSLTTYDIALLNLSRAIKEQLALARPYQVTSLLEFLTTHRANTRFYYLTTTMAKDYIWPSLRDEYSMILDLFMAITMDWKSRMVSESDIGGGYPILCQHMAQGLAVTESHSKTNHSTGPVTDSVFCEKISSGKDTMISLLEQEPWLVVLILLTRHLHQLTEVVRGVGTPPKESRKDEA